MQGTNGKFNPEGCNKYNELTDQLAQQIGEDNPFITLNRAYGFISKITYGGIIRRTFKRY